MADPFPTTQWSEIFALRALGEDGSSRAVAHLYQRYWTPLYAYLRRRGHDADWAADVLQGFFAHLLDHDVVSRLDTSGKLRAFLLAALKNFAFGELERERAQKRRPAQPMISLDLDVAERGYLQIPSADLTPEQVYEKRWALAMVERAVARLEERERKAGREETFRSLRGHVLGGSKVAPYREVAAEVGASEAALKVRVHRLRKRLGEVLREEIEQTVPDARLVDDEVRHLLALL
jgi:RNA polymerase sigma-70 factor (ECF subfamily)